MYSDIYSIAADVLIVAAVALGYWIGWKRGLFRSLLSLVTTLAAMIGAMYLTRRFLDPIAEKYFPKFEEALLDKLNNEWSSKLLPYAEKAGIDLNLIAKDLFSEILRGLMVILLFILLKIVLMLLVRGINNLLFKIPLVGFANHVGGAAFGIAVAAVLVFLVVFVLDKLANVRWTEIKPLTCLAAWVSAHNPIAGFFH